MMMLEVLGQNCTACLEFGVEPVSCDEAPAAVLHALQLYPQNVAVQAAGVRALLSLSGCLNCRCFYDRCALQQPALGSWHGRCDDATCPCPASTGQRVVCVASRS